MKTEEYKNLINQQRFFEAHEVLEEFWFPKRKAKSREVLIAKGFINAAVAFELKKRGKIHNAKRVWKTYLKYSQLIANSDAKLAELKNFVNKFAQEYLF